MTAAGPAGGRLRDAVAQATAELADAGVPSPGADAVTLAAFVLGVPTGEVHRQLVLQTALDAGSRDRYARLVAQRAARVPLQHLTGVAGFRRLELRVGPGVFVPRPETEVLVDLALSALRDPSAPVTPVVVDLCTGSGAIALAVKDEHPAARVHAVELSEAALRWARANRDRLGLVVDLRQGDARTACADLVGAVDVVTSNPPYIPPGAVPVDPEVRDHDPELALYGLGEDGLEVPRGVAARAAALLRPGGVLLMEHADVQRDAVLAALRAEPVWRDVTDHEDLTGRPRVVRAVRADDPS